MSAVDEYLAFRAAFVAKDEEVADLAKGFRTLGDTLDNQREKFSFSNTGVGFPPEVTLNPRNPTLDGSQWKTAKQINELLVQWHEAKSKMHSSWNAIPSQTQGGLQPPARTAHKR